MTPRSAESLLRAYIAIRRNGIAIKALDPGDRVKLPKQDHRCSCGSRKARRAIGKRGDRFLCAGYRCGKLWPMTVAYSASRGSSRPSAPGERDRSLLVDVGWALERLTERHRELLLAFVDHRRVPHARGRWRHVEVSEYLRERHPRATVTILASRVLADYEVALGVFADELREAA